MSIKRAIRSLPAWLRDPVLKIRSKFVDPYVSRSYSQEGEDMILKRIFEGKELGFYVDVGAHHPRRYSNTCFFYRKGWRGINIEPNPEAALVFQRERSRDINIQVGVSGEEGKLTYYFFDDAALNSFSKEQTDSMLRISPYKVIGTKEIPVQRLDRILRQHVPAGTKIDFLTIDVEGFDLEALRSNDWDTYRPTCVLVESLGASLEEISASEVFSFMRGRGYKLRAKTVNTLIFGLGE